SESDPESEEDGDSAFAVRVPEVRVVDSRIEVSDESLQPAFRATLGIDQAALSGFDSAEPQALPLSLGGSVNEALLSVEGTLAWAEGALGADISLDGFQLADLDPIIRSLVPLSITGGALTAQVNLDTAQGQARGGASIEALAAEWLEPQHQVVEGAAIEIQEVVAALDPPAVRIAGIGLSGAEMLVRRFEDGSTVFSRLAAGGEASDETAAEESAEDPVALVIDEIRLEGQTVRFEDLAISPNYRTVLSDLSGTVSDVGTENLTVELTTNIDGQAPLQINGRIGEDLQIDVSANNIAMSPVSPYSGKFVGYRIERGKLKTDLNYQLTGTRLRGSNNLVLDDFELGETVASEDAVSVPLKLGLALLRDLDGKIRLDIPVSGDVSDPSFSVGGVILKAFANVFVKLAASPFKILGALVPGGGEDLQVVEFMPGRTAPVADETDALAQLAEALTRRPALRLDVSGVAVRALDGPALQRERLRARLEAADEADYRQKVTDAWLERFLPPATEPPVEDEPDAPSEPALPTFEEMEAPLLAEIDISNETLRALADERAQNIVAAFSSKPDLAERVFRLAPTVLESGEGDTIEVELAVDAR
ncbi:MAG: DUF748 domain-containing protein, partial [Xanthomonadales bacterium]|nr:DUF748 domain-containing protein [Xanthomonadales bacterium]